MIPKVIYYIWFSDAPYLPLVQKCIESWKRNHLDYYIKLWNCDNFYLNLNKWTSQAFFAKKYAFVTDYAQLWIHYNYVGIYIDFDVEIKRDFGTLLTDSAFIGFIAKPRMNDAKHKMIGKLLDYYSGRQFILDDNGYDTKILPEILYEAFLKEGMEEDINDKIVSNVHIYPPGYFLMSDDLFYLSYEEGTHYLKETYSLHYATGSWSSVTNKYYLLFKRMYLKNFWGLYRILRVPVMFRIWQMGINAYWKMFWG